LLRQITDVAAGPPRLVENIVTTDADAAGTGCQRPGDHLHGRGLAGTVRAEKAQYLTTVDLKADITDGAIIAVITLQALDTDQRFLIHRRVRL